MKIAVVGQICTGKTTVLKYLNNKYPYLKIIITDQLVKKLHQNKEVRAKLNDIFPELLKLSLKKRLNWLREMIFLTKNEGIRIKLFFDYFYPLIKQSICSSFANNQGKLIILECPILFNLNWESQIDKIILLTSYRKLKVNRFENKRKSLSWTKVKINKLLTYQLNNLNIKAQKSDYIVSNNKSKKHLFQKIESILTSFLR